MTRSSDRGHLSMDRRSSSQERLLDDTLIVKWGSRVLRCQCRLIVCTRCGWMLHERRHLLDHLLLKSMRRDIILFEVSDLVSLAGYVRRTGRRDGQTARAPKQLICGDKCKDTYHDVRVEECSQCYYNYDNGARTAVHSLRKLVRNVCSCKNEHSKKSCEKPLAGRYT